MLNMDLDFPNADQIESLCHALVPEGDDTPTAIAPRCKDDAVTWFVMPDGTRLYVCRDHALEPFRFPVGERARDELPDDYNELLSYASEQGLGLQNPDREEVENRLLSPPDPTNVDENPRVRRCATCTRLTLDEDTTVVEGRCKSCDEGIPELDPADYAVTTPPDG